MKTVIDRIVRPSVAGLWLGLSLAGATAMANSAEAVAADTAHDQLATSSQAAPIVLEFSASWCGRCPELAPVLREQALQHGIALNVVRLDLDTDPALAQRYAVRGLPTVIVLDRGEIALRIEGLSALDRLF